MPVARTKVRQGAHLKVWRQKSGTSPGSFRDYDAKDIPSEASFLEMLDIVNKSLTGKDPIAFDSDRRKGICGMCSLVINGIPHGPGKGTTCQLYMRRFGEGETIWIEPFRAAAFPPVKDLVVDRTAFDRIIEAGGYIVARTGSAPEANSLPVTTRWRPPHASDAALVWQHAGIRRRCCSFLRTCPTLALPQGQAKRDSRVLNMVRKMDELGFGNCRPPYECEAICPAEVSASFIARMNRITQLRQQRMLCRSNPRPNPQNGALKEIGEQCLSELWKLLISRVMRHEK